MRTRPYHHGDLRAALLTRAERTLGEKGPGALSLRELAREIGVSPAAPSRHFRSKQALLDALALEGFGRLATGLIEAHDAAGDAFAERVLAVTRAYLDFAVANAALLDLMYSVKHDPAASEELIDAGQRVGSLAAALIREGQRQGAVREGPLEEIGLPVMATLHGFAVLAASGTLPADSVEQGMRDTVAFVLRGCAP
ncbi:TetR/AcrR family transcriptional regulator [Streptomyces radicis]|uniref:TetR/AcrR family transcriptional regulator n=1 Tax=Streptomyces radicis TaxID=1750517 RepID=A0A3A9WN53_9ACTN|nr:TetR/AcrR family transcriptional regulator [Streptomyces radicis]RKN10894.1 TetR/AcrR family transcriptional regulator [Streptomyces radicis]RKN25410.1 TetR/AcrR family transcriptional regulator [Streptomyces radicis]